MIEKILFKGMPEYVTFFITKRCNCRCKHCFVDINKEQNELTLEEIAKMSKTMGKFSVLSLTGGEPFLREDIGEIARIFYKNNSIKFLIIPTNGSLDIIDKVKGIKENCPKLNIRIFVSIDEIGQKHNEIRRLDVFDKAVNTVKELKKIDGIKVGTITTFSTLNQDRIFDIKEWIKVNLQPNLMNFPIVRDNDKLSKINISIYEKLVSDLKTDNIINKAKKVMNNLVIETIKKDKYLTPCYAGSINAVIYPNGDIYPCELLNSKIGNIKDFNYNFRKLWFSLVAKKIRLHIKKTKCFCVHGCNMLPNVIFNPKYYYKILMMKSK